jgi:hypothetical protein
MFFLTECLRRHHRHPLSIDTPMLESYCHFYHARIVYILNQDFMFFSASERWADRIMTELSRKSLNLVADPVDGILKAIGRLRMVSVDIEKRALDMKANLSRWPNGHLWEASRQQVNLAEEGAKRVIERESVLMKALAVEVPLASASKTEVESLEY